MNHKDLDAWKLSFELVNRVYEVTKKFPDDERFGLVNQMRRCAVSIPSNIAEGSARQHNKEMIQFLHVALGSLAELETQILIAINQNYMEDNSILTKVENARKPLIGLIKYLK